MTPIKHWFKSRQQPAEPSQLPRSLEDLLERTEAQWGPAARRGLVESIVQNCDSLVSQYCRDSVGPSSEQQAIMIFNALTKQTSKDQLLSRAPELLRRSIDQKLKSSWQTIANHASVQDLQKMAVSPKTWSKMVNRHDPAGADLVNHKPHLQSDPAPEQYRSMLDSPESHKPVKGLRNGVSAKMIHAVPKGKTTLTGDTEADRATDFVMAKPYHKKIESCTRSWCKHPILGWATMATKHLFDAGGIGHLCEDVTAHEHQGIPMTVHRFKPSMQEVSESHDDLKQNQYTFDHNDIMKIATMDFLTNNVDRHGGNMMVPVGPSDTNAQGYNALLAIDHERNFQYQQTVRHHCLGPPPKPGAPRWFRAGSGRLHDETPLDYAEVPFGFRGLQQNSFFEGHEAYLDWWKEKAPAIKEAFNQQLMLINDPHVRDHLKRNFQTRAEWMDRFAQYVEANGKQYHQDAFREIPGAKILETRRPKAESIKRVIEQLPDDPRQAFDQVADWLHRKKDVRSIDLDKARLVLDKKLTDLPREKLWDLWLHGLTSPKYQKIARHEQLGNSYHPGQMVPGHILNRNDQDLNRWFQAKLESLDPKIRNHSNADWWLENFKYETSAREAA